MPLSGLSYPGNASPTSVLSGGLAGGTFSKTCKCPTCKYQRSLPKPSEKVQQFNEWGRKIAAELTEKLRTLGLAGWQVKWVDWDDPSRLKGSCWGSNITDFRMKLFKDGHWLSCFVVGTQNFNPTGVYMPVKEIECIKRDAATGETRQTTLDELLKNAGTEFAHLGLPPDCNLSQGEDQKCFFKVQATVVMVGEGEEAHLGAYGCNYQAGAKPRNLTFLMTSQDTHMKDDRKDVGEYETRCLMGEYNKDTKKVETFYTTTDVSRRTIAQSGSETKEEALAAIKEGKACETRLGPKGGRKCAAQLFVQLPIDQAALEHRREVPEWSPPTLEALEGTSPAPKKQKAAPAPVYLAPALDPNRPPSPVSMPWSEASDATVKTEAAPAEEFVLPAWGSADFGPIGSGGAGVPVALLATTTAPAAAPAAAEADVKMETVEEEAEAEAEEDAPLDGEEAEDVQTEDCPHKDCGLVGGGGGGDAVYRSLGAAGDGV